MKRSSFGESDYAFGQAILTLRTAIGLTQAGLAERLGISRRAIGDWEAGNSYPKTEHLKHLIELGLTRQAFPAGDEAEAIRSLWQAAHQKTSLDEHWLSTLLGQQCSRQPRATNASREALVLDKSATATATTLAVTTEPRVDWGDALTVPTFYGREQEVALLAEWIVQERCRVVSLLGMGGIGKSALAVHLMHRLARHFEIVIFRSLRDAPSCEELLDSCLRVMAPQSLRPAPTSLQQRISLLLEHLRTSRTLLVLDNLESLLDTQGRWRPNLAGYERLLRQEAETAHQSCLLLTSREKLAVLRPLVGKHSPVRSIHLKGLGIIACEQLFADNAVTGTAQDQSHLAKLYAGNPLALKIVVETIVDLFGGEIRQFFAGGAVIFSTIADLLHEQFARLTPLERIVMNWLAIVREPITLDELLNVLIMPLSHVQVLEAIDGLRRRSLIERGQRQGSFMLQSVVLEYLTAVLIDEILHELQQQKLDITLRLSLEQAYAREYIRQTQERLLVLPILTYLQNAEQRPAQVEEQILSLLNQIRKLADYAQGYGPANLITLLRLQRGHLCKLDLSNLAIRGAYLQGTAMQNTSLRGAFIRDTVFTEALDAIWSVAISSTGQYWAAGTWRGEVRVWSGGGLSLHLAWQAHTDNVFTLAFSPDERLLATGSWDGAVKLWDLQSGTLLWTRWYTDHILSVAFAPDGDTLVGGGNDATLRFWDVPTGQQVQTLKSQGGAVYSIIWSPDGSLLANGCFDGRIQIWQTQGSRSASYAKTLAGHTNWVHSVAFAPDGNYLASASWDNTVKLWDITSGLVYQTLTGHTQQVYSVAWSRDGRTVASAGQDETVWLWDVTQKRYTAALRGHTAAVYGLAFTSDSNNLLSGSEDSTLRVWDVTSGQHLRTIEGYAVSIYDLAWSPNRQSLASTDSNMLVTQWDLTGKMPPRRLRGHRWIVYGIAWSPDGQWLASAGWDNAIRLWEPITGECQQVLRDPDNSDTLFQGIAWSPDGRWLASGTYMQGVQMWDMTTYTCRWAEKTHQTTFRYTAWNPTGTRIASGGDDGRIYIWNAVDGTLQLRIPGHHGIAANVAWGPDGSLLASAGGGRGRGELFVWNTQSGERVHDFVGHPGVVWAVTWDLRNNQLISGDNDGILRWWDEQSGQCVHVQAAHQGAIRSLRISPEGCRLASCGTDGTIKLWDLQSARLLQTLRHNRPYEGLNITGIRGLTEAQKDTLRVLGAIEEDASSLQA